MREAQVVRFVSEDEQSGYLGVIEHKVQGQKFVYICFRGTNDFVNAMSDLDSAQIEFPLWDAFPRAAQVLEQRGIIQKHTRLLVHQGFYGLHSALLRKRFSSDCDGKAQTSLADQSDPAAANYDPAAANYDPAAANYDPAAANYAYYVNQVLAGTTVVLSGHSLGGALAVLDALTLALFLIESGHQRLTASLKLITFGQPRVGNLALAELVNHLVPDYFRIVAEGDPVPTVPGMLAVSLKTYLPRCYCGSRRFKHAGNLVMVKPGGVLIGRPSAVEMKYGTDVNAHSMKGYEVGIELYLLGRNRWLWRKAVFVVRLVVKMNQMCKGANEIDRENVLDGSAVLIVKRTS